MATNNGELTDEQKRIIVGKCSFMLISVYSTIAIICGLQAVSWCDFAKRDIILADPYNITTGCDHLGLAQVTCDAFMNHHAIGFYSWQVQVPVDQILCTSYTISVDGVGWIEPDFDTKFNAARVFSVIANVFGFFAWFTIVMASCCPLSQQRLNGLSLYFFIASFFQGMTLIILRSDVCDVGFFLDYFMGTNVGDKINDVIANVECSLDRGGKNAIVACVFYFLSMNQIPTAVVPPPIGYRRAAQEAADNAGVEEGAAPVADSPPAATE